MIEENKYKQELNDALLIWQTGANVLHKEAARRFLAAEFFLTSVKWIFMECGKIKLQHITT